MLKSFSTCLSFLLLTSWSQLCLSQIFTNGQNADLVLGQSSFTTSDAGVDDAKISSPKGVAFDPATGKLFVACYSSHRVLRWSSVNAAISGSAAEAVLGQTDFTSQVAARTQNGMDSPAGICIDNSGRLWVADYNNCRVLRFDNAATKTNGANADAVLGQANFTILTYGTSANLMQLPNDVAVDNSGHLYVADRANRRILRFDDAANRANGATADGVLGQPNFASFDAATTQNGINNIFGVCVDQSGNLFVADGGNNRVLRFDNAASKGNGVNADGVLGHVDFTTQASGLSQGEFNTPTNLAIDNTGRLYVVDQGNNRVLWFDNATSNTNGGNADGVLGQPDYETAIQNTTQNGLRIPTYVAVNNSAGKIYISDGTNNRVLRFSASGSFPVELISFTAAVNNAEVLLHWSTATEINNYGFNIERRDVNSFNWQKIGFVAGSGTSNVPKEYSFTDNKLPSGKYSYRLKQIDRDGQFKYSEIANVNITTTPIKFGIDQNYPNPTNPSTTISFAIPTRSHVTLTVFNTLGQKVAELENAEKDAGPYNVTFDVSGLASGVYLYRMEAGSFVQTRKLVVVK